MKREREREKREIYRERERERGGEKFCSKQSTYFLFLPRDPFVPSGLKLNVQGQ